MFSNGRRVNWGCGVGDGSMEGGGAWRLWASPLHREDRRRISVKNRRGARQDGPQHQESQRRGAGGGSGQDDRGDQDRGDPQGAGRAAPAAGARQSADSTSRTAAAATASCEFGG